MLRITNFNVPFMDETPLASLAARRLQLPPQAVLEVEVVRRAVDARRYNHAPIQFVYVLHVKVAENEKKVLARLRGDRRVERLEIRREEPLTFGGEPLEQRPVIVGFGPAGMFAALALARQGYRPLVLERGGTVAERTADIERFWRTCALNPQSNVQFGEGGAGTFSDGKLTTRTSDPQMRWILEQFVEAGAPREILYLHKPHIGTDILCTVVKNIREKIIALGADVRFHSAVTDIEVKNDRVVSLTVNDAERIPVSVVLLGIGHSARDTYALLHEKGVAMEAKAFAVGVRIEHPQSMIDAAQYGDQAGHPRLGAADYALVYQDRALGRGVYSFCMCPGGQVVAAASEEHGVVTNGMSCYRRDSGIANSALLVSVGAADFGSDVLDGVRFQRRCERLAFQAGGGDYFAPVQTAGDFLAGRRGSGGFLTEPTYAPGVREAALGDYLPDFITGALAKAIPYFGGRLQGFDHRGAVMTGVETRSSAPCRIVRGSELVSVNTQGLYPIGEGAGYAGGIMSAAADGIHAAVAIMKKYRV